MPIIFRMNLEIMTELDCIEEGYENLKRTVMEYSGVPSLFYDAFYMQSVENAGRFHSRHWDGMSKNPTWGYDLAASIHGLYEGRSVTWDTGCPLFNY